MCWRLLTRESNDVSEHRFGESETLPELTKQQQARLDELVDGYSSAVADDPTVTIEQLAIDDPQLIPHLRATIAQRQSVDFYLQAPTLVSPPQKIEGFQFQTVMGSGATGVVFKCSQQNGNRDVAVKVMKPDLDLANQQASFQREISTAASVAGTGVVAIHQTGTTRWAGKECFWFSMELLEGGTICAYARRNQLSISERLSLARSFCSTLDRLHQAGILHRDLKPSNILTSADGCPHVVDFGIAKFTNAKVDIQNAETEAPFRGGTLGWSAPELLRYDSRTPADVRSELFSVGLILFDLLAERHPFAVAEDSTFDVSQRIINEPAPLLTSVLPNVSPDLECFVSKLLQANPADRYQSYSDVIAEIDCLLAGTPVKARKLSTYERCSRFVSRHRTAILSGTIAVLALVFTSVRFYLLSENLGTQQGLLQTSNRKLVEQQLVLANRSRELQDSILQRDRSLRNSRLLNLSLLVVSDPKTTREVLDDNEVFPSVSRLLAWRSLWRDSLWEIEMLPQLDDSASRILFADDIDRLLVVSKSRETFLVNRQQQTVQKLKAVCFHRSQPVRRPGSNTCLIVDQDLALCEIDLMAGHPIARYPVTIGMTGRFAVSSDGQFAAGVNDDGKCFVLDFASPQRVQVINDSVVPLICIWFSDFDRLVCGLTHDGKIQKWDRQIEGGAAVQTIDLTKEGLPSESQRTATYVGRIQGGEALAIRSNQGEVYVYRPTAFVDKLITRLPLGGHGEIARRLTLAEPDALFVLERSVIEYPLKGSSSPRLFPVFENEATAFALSDNGRKVAIGNSSGELAITSVPSMDVGFREFAALSSSEHGATGIPNVVVNHPLHNNVAIGYSGGWVRTAGVKDPNTFANWYIATGPVTDVSWHPTKQVIAVSVGGDSPVLCLCKVDQSDTNAAGTDSLDKLLISTEKRIRKVQFSECGDFLLAALRDGRVLKLDAATLKTVAEWKFHQAGCFGLDVLKDAVVSADSDGVICLRNWKSGELLSSWQAHDKRIADVQFAPNGDLVFSCSYDSTLKSWTQDGRLVQTFSGHNQEVTDFAFADHGQTLLSGGRDRSVKFWDTATGELQRSIVAQSAEIRDILYRESQDQLLSASADGSVRSIVD